MITGFLSALTLPRSVTVAVFVAAVAILEPWFYQPSLLNEIDDHWVLLLNFAAIYSGVMCLIWLVQYQADGYPKLMKWASDRMSLYFMPMDEASVVAVLSKNPDSPIPLPTVYNKLAAEYETVTVQLMVNRLEKKGILHKHYGNPSFLTLTELGVLAAEHQRLKRRDAR
nr:hypothetical protein 16 [Saccharospirillaceae bacterium]